MPLLNVACKLPNGLVLELGDKRVILKGSNSSLIIGGHGITEGVDADFFNAWLAAHQDLAFVQEGFLFAHEKANNTAAQAKERADVETGLEPMDPDAKPAGLTEV